MASPPLPASALALHSINLTVAFHKRVPSGIGGSAPHWTSDQHHSCVLHTTIPNAQILLHVSQAKGINTREQLLVGSIHFSVVCSCFTKSVTGKMKTGQKGPKR